MFNYFFGLISGALTLGFLILVLFPFPWNFPVSMLTGGLWGYYWSKWNA